MTDQQTPPDWVLIEAAKRSGCDVLVADYIRYNIFERNAIGSFRALCDMIAKYEQPPVDRKVLCAREAAAILSNFPHMAEEWRSGKNDKHGLTEVCIRAIELWESGYGQ